MLWIVLRVVLVVVLLFVLAVPVVHHTIIAPVHIDRDKHMDLTMDFGRVLDPEDSRGLVGDRAVDKGLVMN
jgi:hypothetical protein